MTGSCGSSISGFLRNLLAFAYRAWVHAKCLQWCPTLYDARDCSLPGSSFHGILISGGQVSFTTPQVSGLVNLKCPQVGTSLAARLVKTPTCNAGDLGSIRKLGSSPGEGKGYPPQHSGLDNSMDCVVHGVAKSRKLLIDFHFHNYKHTCIFNPKLPNMLKRSVFPLLQCLRRQRMRMTCKVLRTLCVCVCVCVCACVCAHVCEKSQQ